MLPETIFCGQLFICLFQFKQPEAELIAQPCRSLRQRLRASHPSISCACAPSVPHAPPSGPCCSRCVCDQHAAEAFKAGLCPFFALAIVVFKAARLDARTFGGCVDPDARFPDGRLTFLLERLHRRESRSRSAARSGFASRRNEDRDPPSV